MTHTQTLHTHPRGLLVIPGHGICLRLKLFCLGMGLNFSCLATITLMVLFVSMIPALGHWGQRALSGGGDFTVHAQN